MVRLQVLSFAMAILVVAIACGSPAISHVAVRNNTSAPIQVRHPSAPQPFTIPADGGVWLLPPVSLANGDLDIFDEACNSTSVAASAPVGQNPEGNLLMKVGESLEVSVEPLSNIDGLGLAEAGAEFQCD